MRKLKTQAYKESKMFKEANASERLLNLKHLNDLFLFPRSSQPWSLCSLPGACLTSPWADSFLNQQKINTEINNKKSEEYSSELKHLTERPNECQSWGKAAGRTHKCRLRISKKLDLFSWAMDLPQEHRWRIFSNTEGEDSIRISNRNIPLQISSL